MTDNEMIGELKKAIMMLTNVESQLWFQPQRSATRLRVVDIMRDVYSVISDINGENGEGAR